MPVGTRADTRSAKLTRPTSQQSVLRAERNSPDLALLDEADPPLRRAIGKMDKVEVTAISRNGPERHSPQCTEPRQYRLGEHQLLARASGHLRRHVVVFRRAPAKPVDIFTDRLLAASHRASALRARPARLL